jgi:hypothetical protein
MKHITATFDDSQTAEHALERLLALGIDRAAISLLMSESPRAADIGNDGPRPLEGAGVGGAMGGLAGAVIGGLVAVGSLVIPGAGLLAAGPLVAALAGAGAGGAAGSLIGGFAALGLSDADSETSATAIEKGKIFVAAWVDDVTADRASLAMRGEGGRQVHTDP